jgi:hypothetical protein
MFDKLQFVAIPGKSDGDPNDKLKFVGQECARFYNNLRLAVREFPGVFRVITVEGKVVEAVSRMTHTHNFCGVRSQTVAMRRTK